MYVCIYVFAGEQEPVKVTKQNEGGEWVNVRKVNEKCHIITHVR